MTDKRRFGFHIVVFYSDKARVTAGSEGDIYDIFTLADKSRESLEGALIELRKMVSLVETKE